MKDKIQQLEHFMYGHNYQVTFGYEFLNPCITLEEAKNKIIEIFKDANPDEYKIIRATTNEFWQEIDYGFNYRGDEGAGLKLNNEKLEKVLRLQNQFKEFIKTFINETTLLFHYPSYKGIPCYPVFWDYRFIILNKDGNSLLLYGAASD